MRIRILWIMIAALFFTATVGIFSPTELQAETFSTLTGALDALSSKYKVQFGLEYAPGDADNHPFDLDTAPDLIAPVLDQLVRQKPAYSWGIVDGVYNLYPKTNANSVLEIRVRSYAIHTESLARASEEINRIPEVAEWLAKQGVRRREIEVGGPNNTVSDAPVSVTLNQVTLRTVLNALVKGFRCSNWTVVRYGDTRQFLAIYFR